MKRYQRKRNQRKYERRMVKKGERAGAVNPKAAGQEVRKNVKKGRTPKARRRKKEERGGKKR